MIVFEERDARSAAAIEYQRQRLLGLAEDMRRVGEGTFPWSSEGSHAPLLDGWILARSAVPCLVGLSTGHPKLHGVNRPITTSDLWLLSEDRTWARTLSRWYRLGRPATRSNGEGV